MMIMTDPIADMLTRIRNGVQARHEVVEIPAIKEKISTDVMTSKIIFFSLILLLILSILFEILTIVFYFRATKLRIIFRLHPQYFLVSDFVQLQYKL